MKKASRRQLEGPVSVFRPAVAFGAAGTVLEVMVALMFSYFQLEFTMVVPWMLMGVGLMVLGLVSWILERRTVGG